MEETSCDCFSKMRLILLFILLLLASAAFILAYMGWTMANRGTSDADHFTLQIQNQARERGKVQNQIQNRKSTHNNPLIGDGDVSFDHLSHRRDKSLASDPENEGLPPGLISVNSDVLRADPDLQRRIDYLKMKVISKLRGALLGGAKVKGHINHYGVDFSKVHKLRRPERNDVLCKIKALQLKLIGPGSSSVFQDKPFPSDPLMDDGSQHFSADLKPTPLYKKCAVIPNSGAFLGARHGIDIDSHDFILRFNNAPTASYEDDVGSLTSLRIVNSQVVTKPQFGFPSSKYYGPKGVKKTPPPTPSKSSSSGSPRSPLSPSLGRGAGLSREEEDARNTQLELDDMDLDGVWDATRKYLIWDPCNYSSNLEEWYSRPDFPLFEKYFNLTGSGNSGSNFYLLDCRVIWRMWELLQEYSFTKIHGNPPTSGFIGIMLSLQFCERVNVLEYIPSVRESGRCHYYSPRNDSNGRACTYGAWHPVAAEKLFFLSLTDGSDKDVFMDGLLPLPGVSTIDC